MFKRENDGCGGGEWGAENWPSSELGGGVCDATLSGEMGRGFMLFLSSNHRSHP